MGLPRTGPMVAAARTARPTRSAWRTRQRSARSAAVDTAITVGANPRLFLFLSRVLRTMSGAVDNAGVTVPFNSHRALATIRRTSGRLFVGIHTRERIDDLVIGVARGHENFQVRMTPTFEAQTHPKELPQPKWFAIDDVPDGSLTLYLFLAA